MASVTTDWAWEELEQSLQIPTFPGSSLSLYYDNINGAAGDTVYAENHLGEVPHSVFRGGEGVAEQYGDGRGSTRLWRASNGTSSGRSGMFSNEQPVILYDEFGFRQLSDPEPGMDAALQLREEPPEFDELGATTYQELCRSMGLTPISRFTRQLTEGVVDLKFYGATPQSVRAISQALMYNPHGHTLDLTGNWMSDECCYYLAELLLRENITLETLILRGCNLSARAAELLAEGVELNHSVRRLDLADNHLGDEGVRALQESLARNEELAELDLSNNGLGAQAAASLGKALTENRTLRVLRLARNNLYEDVPIGLRALLRALQQREDFHLLDLAWNALNESAAVPLKVFLIRGSVQELYLNNNRLPGSAIDIIKIGVRKSSTLQHLWIGFNPMEPENAMNLLQACQGSQTIQTLDLDGIRVHADFRQLKKRLEDARDMTIIIDGVLSAYEIKGPNLQEMMLKRARFEGLKPKKKRRKKDFGHLLLELSNDGKETILPEQFTEAALKKKKMKIRVELLRALYEQFKAKKGFVDASEMLSCYMKLFPDTELPPPVPKKAKKKKRKRGKKKSNIKSDNFTRNLIK